MSFSRKSEILSELDTLQISVLVSSIIFILIGLGIIYIIANNISNGIKSTSKHLELLAEGNLCEEVSTRYLKLKDEIDTIVSSSELIKNYVKVVDDVNNVNTTSK